MITQQLLCRAESLTTHVKDGDSFSTEVAL